MMRLEFIYSFKNINLAKGYECSSEISMNKCESHIYLRIVAIFFLNDLFKKNKKPQLIC